uniref:Uncharacterized protein n=1 Tax=Panagrolaimus superbus TaxID=310955 RepID=A0A914YVY5_9BILA
MLYFGSFNEYKRYAVKLSIVYNDNKKWISYLKNKKDYGKTDYSEDNEEYKSFDNVINPITASNITPSTSDINSKDSGDITERFDTDHEFQSFDNASEVISAPASSTSDINSQDDGSIVKHVDKWQMPSEEWITLFLQSYLNYEDL